MPSVGAVSASFTVGVPFSTTSSDKSSPTQNASQVSLPPLTSFMLAYGGFHSCLPRTIVHPLFLSAATKVAHFARSSPLIPEMSSRVDQCLPSTTVSLPSSPSGTLNWAWPKFSTVTSLDALIGSVTDGGSAGSAAARVNDAVSTNVATRSDRIGGHYN